MRTLLLLPLLVACTEYDIGALDEGHPTPDTDADTPGADQDPLDPTEADRPWWEDPFTEPPPDWESPLDSSDGDDGEGGDDDPWDEDTWDSDGIARMTGGGVVHDGGFVFTHGFTLHCAGSHHANHLQLTLPERSFHLESVDWVACVDDPGIDTEQPWVTFDTVVGVGSGRIDGTTADIWFLLTDDGEPGTTDTARFEIALGPWGIAGEGPLYGGNHQAHDPI